MSTHLASASTQERIVALVANVVKAVHPLRVILFGSHARHEANQGSDVDLLVIMPEDCEPRRIARMLYRKIPREGVSLDILVTTPERLERQRDNLGLIYHTILEEGLEVYSR